MRVACLRVPDLPLAAELRAEPQLAGAPLAVASGPGPRAELIAVSPAAARRGVRPRIPVAHARSLCGRLCVRVASPARMDAARAALLDAALACTPRAAPAPRAAGTWAGEAAVYLDASGIAALYPSEAGFAAAVTARAAQLGLAAGIAIASSRRVAHLAARKLAGRGDSLVLAADAEAAFLAPLSLDLLDLDDALAECLDGFGLRTLGDLLALPKRALAARLGPEVLPWIELARGAADETPLPVPESRTLREAVDLEFPVDRLESLGFVLQGLLSRLLDRLEARRLACGELRLALALAGGERDLRRIASAAPTGDLRVLMRLVGRAVEARPPAAPVGAASLETEGSPLRGDQLDLFRPAGPAPTTLDRTLAELEALCGSGRIGAPTVADDHRPEAFGMGPFAPPSARNGAGEPGGSGASRSGPALAVRALRPPLSAQVRVARGHPQAVRSAVANGRVVRSAGPWRTTGGWWAPEEHYAYDCFDVQTDDGVVVRLRLDRIRRVWQIDAVYD